MSGVSFLEKDLFNKVESLVLEHKDLTGEFVSFRVVLGPDGEVVVSKLNTFVC